MCDSVSIVSDSSNRSHAPLLTTATFASLQPETAVMFQLVQNSLDLLLSIPAIYRSSNIQLAISSLVLELGSHKTAGQTLTRNESAENIRIGTIERQIVALSYSLERQASIIPTVLQSDNAFDVASPIDSDEDCSMLFTATSLAHKSLDVGDDSEFALEPQRLELYIPNSSLKRRFAKYQRRRQASRAAEQSTIPSVSSSPSVSATPILLNSTVSGNRSFETQTSILDYTQDTLGQNTSQGFLKHHEDSLSYTHTFDFPFQYTLRPIDSGIGDEQTLLMANTFDLLIPDSGLTRSYTV
ncbi:hypothetical protein QVD99_003631 [Batrachochytrium dendrobatidis]|nr:hypothetical protein QVD99_003631 [Batrachochytrium dendrobatidis]